MAEDCCATQLIDANGEFNAAELENFVNTVNLHQYGLSYAVVAIMGPQSSGLLIFILICYPLLYMLLIKWYPIIMPWTFDIWNVIYISLVFMLYIWLNFP